MNIEAKKEALRDMMVTDGWQLVEKYINERIEANKDQLLTCVIDNVVKHQSSVTALRSVLFYIKDILEKENGED